MSFLRRSLQVPETAIGFAGMKDKVAVARQTVSVHLPGSAPPPDLPAHERIRVLSVTRHGNKIRLGHLSGNRFSIRVRGVDPASAGVARERLEELERRGVPNYFGSQRFGYQRNNHLLGRMLLRREWGALLAELLGDGGSPFPEYQRERRELFSQKRYREAAALWTPADRNQLTVIRALASGRHGQGAVRAAGQAAMSFWVSAAQSAAFNRVLDRRLEEGTTAALVEGDLAWKHVNGAVFRVTAEELARPELAPRLAAFEISPSGPLWGPGMTTPSGDVAALERAALESVGLTESDLKVGPSLLKGARRPLRVPLRHPAVDAGTDEHGPFVRVAFDLPAGAYATVVLREITRTPEPEIE
jgi:tRNA pseudouridine13 synthase